MIFKSSSSKKINERIGLYYTSGRLVFVRFLEEIVGQFEINWPLGSSTQDLYTIILSSSLKPSFPKVQSHYNLVVREKYLPTYLVYCKKNPSLWFPSYDFKVHIFWEGHTNLRNLHRRFVLCSANQIYGGDFANWCELLKIYELYSHMLGIIGLDFFLR